jgi:hypothetical protein
MVQKVFLVPEKMHLLKHKFRDIFDSKMLLQADHAESWADGVIKLLDCNSISP